VKGLGLHLPRATIGVSRWRRFRASVDWPLIGAIVLLCGVGMLNLYSATYDVRREKFDTQLQWMILGGFAFIAVTVIDYRALVRLAWLGLGLAIVLLVIARLTGVRDEIHGNTYRWISLHGFRFQPSELVKVMVVLVLAWLFADAEPSRYTPKRLLISGCALLVPVVMVAVQPDLGTAILTGLIILTVGYLAMPNVWPMVYLTGASLAAIPVLWEKLEKYQRDRLLGFIDCSVTQSNVCRHTQQSIYAVGSGRMWGKGFMNGTQNKLNFVPEHLTDFPFANWAEEWGFAGCLVLLVIFGFLLLWTVTVALSARDRVGSVICVGVAAMIFWHMTVNIAMVLGVAPVVGVTLPFISYGGSSLITFFLAMGLVANVSLRKHGY
jgi:rod shape determining protein RodA